MHGGKMTRKKKKTFRLIGTRPFYLVCSPTLRLFHCVLKRYARVHKGTLCVILAIFQLLVNVRYYLLGHKCLTSLRTSIEYHTHIIVLYHFCNFQKNLEKSANPHKQRVLGVLNMINNRIGGTFDCKTPKLSVIFPKPVYFYTNQKSSNHLISNFHPFHRSHHRKNHLNTFIQIALSSY